MRKWTDSPLYCMSHPSNTSLYHWSLSQFLTIIRPLPLNCIRQYKYICDCIMRIIHVLLSIVICSTILNTLCHSSSPSTATLAHNTQDTNADMISRPQTHQLLFNGWGYAEDSFRPGHVAFGWPLGSNYGFTAWGYRANGGQWWDRSNLMNVDVDELKWTDADL